MQLIQTFGVYISPEVMQMMRCDNMELKLKLDLPANDIYHWGMSLFVLLTDRSNTLARFIYS
jgi:hypothetical protein